MVLTTVPCCASICLAICRTSRLFAGQSTGGTSDSRSSSRARNPAYSFSSRTLTLSGVSLLLCPNSTSGCLPTNLQRHNPPECIPARANEYVSPDASYWAKT